MRNLQHGYIKLQDALGVVSLKAQAAFRLLGIRCPVWLWVRKDSQDVSVGELLRAAGWDGHTKLELVLTIMRGVTTSPSGPDKFGVTIGADLVGSSVALRNYGVMDR